MDTDALWLRAPPDKIEFIGSDASDGGANWFLDAEGTYLAPGVMRFKQKKGLIYRAVENGFK